MLELKLKKYWTSHISGVNFSSQSHIYQTSEKHIHCVSDSMEAAYEALIPSDLAAL